MKKIGKQVAFIGTTAQNPRNGEGSFLRFPDNSIAYIYTEYYAGDGDDHGTARFSAIYSYDEGETWSDPSVFYEKDEKSMNIMSVSCITMQDGGSGIVFLRKELGSDHVIYCMPWFMSSYDNGKTWSKPIVIAELPAYYCAVNDCAIVLKSGRILVTASYNEFCGSKDGGHIHNFCSDDNGKTWFKLDGVIDSPLHDPAGLQEPGIYEQENGRLWCWMRTCYGYQYQAFSDDSGNTWSACEPNLCFSSPDSPMRVKKCDKYAIAVFNPNPLNCIHQATEVWGAGKRTPLICAVSRDDAKSFDSTNLGLNRKTLKEFYDNTYFIEDDLNDSYCYPAVFPVNDGFLISYYHSRGTDVCLFCAKVVKVYYSEIN